MYVNFIGLVTRVQIESPVSLSRVNNSSHLTHNAISNQQNENTKRINRDV